MRMSVAGTLLLTSLTCLAQVQQSLPSHPAQPTKDGGVREVLESIVIPPIPNSPFTATLDTEATKYAADGSTMTFVNERHIARDQQGRIYEERWLLVPKNSDVKSSMNWIQIADPKQRTLYNCSPQRHVCDLVVYDPADDLATAQTHAVTPHTADERKGKSNLGRSGTSQHPRHRYRRRPRNHHHQRRRHGQRSTAHQHQRILALRTTRAQPALPAIQPLLRKADFHHHRTECIRPRPTTLRTASRIQGQRSA